MPPPSVILELRHTGHTLGFAAEIASAAATGDRPVVLALNAAARGSTQMAEVDLPDAVQIRWLDAGNADYLSVEQGLLELRTIAELLRDLESARLSLPTADALLHALTRAPEAREIERTLPPLDLIVHWPLAAQVPTGLSTLREALGGVAELRAVRRHRVLTVDPYAALGPGRVFPRLAGVRPPVFLPHLLRKQSGMTRDEARAALGVPDERFAVIAPGDASPRKAADRLLAAVESPGWPTNTVAVFAGPVAEPLRPRFDAALAATPDRLIVHDRFLDPAEFAACFDAADAVWAVTPSNRGISSTFLYAARAHAPAIVARSHRSARWMCDKVGVGVPTDLSPPAILASIETVRTTPPPAPAQAEQHARFLARITDPAEHRRVVLDG